MNAQIRVYAVQKAKGWDVLSSKQMSVGNIPKTVTHVRVTWGDGSESATIERDDFLATYAHQHGCYWNAIVTVETTEEAVESASSETTTEVLPQELVVNDRTYRINLVYTNGSGTLYTSTEYYRLDSRKWREVRNDGTLRLLAQLAVSLLGARPVPWHEYIAWNKERRVAASHAVNRAAA
jgi:hypothetical protein